MRPYIEVLDFRQRDRRVIESEVGTRKLLAPASLLPSNKTGDGPQQRVTGGIG
jgi:hypothetical protein